MHKCLPRDATHSVRGLGLLAVVRCLSVHLFVTLMYQNFTIKLFHHLVAPSFSFSVKFRRGHPQQGRQIEVGYTKNFRFSTSISEIPIPNTEVFQNTDTEPT